MLLNHYVNDVVIAECDGACMNNKESGNSFSIIAPAISSEKH